MWHGEFRHPRLVEIYDTRFTWSREDDFFLALAGEEPRSRVVDLGCGTGRLTLALAAAGHRVTGIDPAGASLDVARRKAGADRVTWAQGTSAALAPSTADLVLMTSHVSQFIVDDRAWVATLADLHRVLMPGGRLVFDSRDPAQRGWEDWNPVDSRHTVHLSDGTPVELWDEVTAMADGVVSFAMHTREPSGDVLLSHADMRFRTQDELQSSLVGAGFSIEHVFGGWRREPAGSPDGELIVLARRR